MRILLISANREPFPEPVFPVGPVYLASALLRAGAGVRLFDMRYTSSISALKKEIAGFRPSSIGISLRNLDNAAYPFPRFYLPSYSDLVKSVRAMSDLPVILGGPAYSLFPEEISSCLGADGGVKGEGEKGIGIFMGQGNLNQQATDLTDIESVEFPRNISDLFPGFRRYRTIGIQTARGCPNHCIYCTYPYLEGSKRRTRSPEAIAGELAFLHKDHGIRDFFIVDSLFNADEAHMAGVLEKISRMGLPVRISCYLQPKMSDTGIFRLLKKAGCVAVDFGTDSGSPAVLASLRKPFRQDDVRKVSRACGEAGIDYCHSLIFGGPGETPETIRDTIRLMDEISPKAVIAMTGVRIYPGTELERIAREEGAVSPGDPLLEPRFYFSNLGPQRLLNIAYAETAGRRNWFFPGRKDWSSTLGYRLLNILYNRGPLWRTFRK